MEIAIEDGNRKYTIDRAIQLLSTALNHCLSNRALKIHTFLPSPFLFSSLEDVTFLHRSGIE